MLGVSMFGLPSLEVTKVAINLFEAGRAVKGEAIGWFKMTTNGNNPILKIHIFGFFLDILKR